MWPRDLCYVRYWRRNDDGSYGKGFAVHLLVVPGSRSSLFHLETSKLFYYCAVVLFRSREHENCGPEPGFVRAHLESKGSIFFV